MHITCTVLEIFSLQYFSTDGTIVGKLMVMNNYSPSISFFVCVSSVSVMFPETVLVY